MLSSNACLPLITPSFQHISCPDSSFWKTFHKLGTTLPRLKQWPCWNLYFLMALKCLAPSLHFYPFAQRGAGVLCVQWYSEPPQGLLLQRHAGGGRGGHQLCSTLQICPTQHAAPQPTHHRHSAETEGLSLCLWVRCFIWICPSVLHWSHCPPVTVTCERTAERLTCRSFLHHGYLHMHRLCDIFVVVSFCSLEVMCDSLELAGAYKTKLYFRKTWTKL